MVLTVQKGIPPQRQAEAFPEYSFWIYLTYLLFFSAFLIFIAALWLRIKIAYAVALIYIASCLIYYFAAYPNYPTFFFILEAIQLALLLSLWNYFTKP
jgi:hypothetical protein